MSPTYAVFFKTHFWDEFAERQLRRLCAHVGRGVVYVVLDGTFGTAPVLRLDRSAMPALAAEPVIIVTDHDLARLGLEAVTTHGSVIWYNPDYPNYVAAARIADYDYYVPVEYDVVVNTSLDDLIDRVARDQVDYLGFALRTPVKEWPWYELHKESYGPKMLHCLSCIGVFSKRALDELLAQRQAGGRAFRAGKLAFWPNNEAFIPNEIAKAGMTQASLADYGATAHYDWWPPVNEAALTDYGGEAFIHPVLNGTRFIRSTLFHEPSFLNLLLPASPCKRRLKNFEAALVRPMVRAEIKRRVGAKLDRLAQRIGLRPKWFAAAQSGGPRERQTASAHNAG